MAKDIMKSKVAKQYKARIDFNETRGSILISETQNIGSYLYRKFHLNCDIGSWFNIFNSKIHYSDGKGLEVKIATSIYSNSPFTLAFNAKIKYPESLTKKAEKIMAALAAYNYDTMRI